VQCKLSVVQAAGTDHCED